MKHIYLFVLCFLLVPFGVQSQDRNSLPPEATEFYEPVPPKIEAGSKLGAAPSDAIILFDGTGLEEWESSNTGSKPNWEVAAGVLTVKPGSGAIKTRKKFGDVQLHLEWRSPAEIEGDGQNRGNSGVFLMDTYEVQVLDSHGNNTYTNGQAGSIYKQSPPLVNASNPPGEWNTYDIIFRAPVFNQDGMLLKPARLTLLHNGVLVQDNFELKGPTEYIGIPNYVSHPEALSISLQDHGSPVSFRNIWVRELNNLTLQ